MGGNVMWPRRARIQREMALRGTSPKNVFIFTLFELLMIKLSHELNLATTFFLIRNIACLFVTLEGVFANMTLLFQQ